jgi:PLP dependent protein
VTVAASPAVVADRLAAVQARIAAAGGDMAAITIVAVTKGFGADAVAAAVGAGLGDIGENYAQEVLAKWVTPAAHDVRLHFIGRLQSNKVRQLAPFVDVWQSVDRVSVAIEIGKRKPGADVLVQVNVSDEPTKGGCAPAQVDALVDAARDAGLHVRGIMAVGKTGPPAQARGGFALARQTCDRLGLAVCSMGMTDDLEVAVGEGSTMVRIGSALFGMRPTALPTELA